MTKDELERAIARDIVWSVFEVSIDAGRDDGVRDNYEAQGEATEDGILKLTRYAPKGDASYHGLSFASWVPDRKIRARVMVEILSDEEVK